MKLGALALSGLLALGAATPADLDVAVAELESRLARADAVHEALGLVQNALAESAGFDGPIACDPAVASLIARARVFGQAHRDAAQSSRVSHQRVQAVAESATVAPLVVGTRARALADLAERADHEVARQRQAAAWQWIYIEQRPGIERCTTPLTETPGLQSPTRTVDQPTAVYVIGEGVQIQAGHLPAAVVKRR